MSSFKSKEIKLDDQIFFPAHVDGNPQVYKNPEFTLVRRPWQPDESAQTCWVCNSKFGGLKRRHHCRQCGRVVCNKCCNEKVLLQHYGYTETERVCDPCRPIADVVIKSRADNMHPRVEAAQRLTEFCKDPQYIIRLFSYGGFHSILSLAGKSQHRNSSLIAKVLSCLHILSTNEPLLDFMVEAGTISALCDILGQADASEESLLLDGVSALLIFCRSNRFKIQGLKCARNKATAIITDIATILQDEMGSMMKDSPFTLSTDGSNDDSSKLFPMVIRLNNTSGLVESELLSIPVCNGAATALEAGSLPVILTLCGNPNEKVALMALTCLSVVVEQKATHKPIIDDDRQALPSLLALCKSENSQLQALALKCLTNLSLGSDWNKHRIVQEDYSTGKVLKTVLQSDTDNMQVLCNTACLIANLATSQEDQASLSGSLDSIIQRLQSDIANTDLLNNVTRGLANFSKYPQNTAKVRNVLADIEKYCLRHSNLGIVKQGLRLVFNLLSLEAEQTCHDLSRDGAGLILKLLGDDKNIVTSIKTELMKQVSDLNTPL